VIEAMGLNYIEAPSNGITSLPDFMKIYQAVQKFLVRDRQTGDLISLLSFFESRLQRYGPMKIENLYCLQFDVCAEGLFARLH
jgi:hypothetical protein